MKKLLATLCIILLSATSHSAMAKKSYWGAGVGPSSFSLKPFFETDETEDGTAIRLLFGKRNNNTSFELDFSFADYDWTYNPGNSHSVLNIVLSGVGYLPVSENFSLFGKVGVNIWSTTVDFLGETLDGDDGIGIAASGGIDFAASESFHITAEFQILPGLSDGIDDGDISQFLVNGVYYY